MTPPAGATGPDRIAGLSRRRFLGGAGLLATTIAGLGDRQALAASLTASAATSGPPPTLRLVKPPIVGLVDRDGSATNYAYRDRAEHFGAFVGRVDHATVHLAPGRFEFGPIDTLLDEAESLDLRVRLRLYLGIQVVAGVARPACPRWLREIVGTVTVGDPNWVSPGPTPRFWHPEYRRYYRELMAALAARYDDDERLAEVHGLPGALIGGETMIQRYDNDRALLAAGYPGWAADRDLQAAFLADYAQAWTHTGLYLAINTFQRVGTSTDIDTSFELIDAGLAIMGGQLRPANNSLVADDHLVEQRGGTYRAIYERMRDVWAPSGISCQLQTDNPRNIAGQGAGTGTLDGTVRYAATIIGATSLELPHTYTDHLDQLGDWAELFPAPFPQVPPSRLAAGPSPPPRRPTPPTAAAG